jgi:hypothetical protein
MKARKIAKPPAEPEPPDPDVDAEELLTGASGPERGAAGALASCPPPEYVRATEVAADVGWGAIRNLGAKASLEPGYGRFAAT